MLGDDCELGSHFWPLTGEFLICFVFPRGEVDYKKTTILYVHILSLLLLNAICYFVVY